MSGHELAQTKTDKTAPIVIAVGAVFVAWSMISVHVPGVNEPHYLTKSRHFADCSWCANDFFLQSSNAHAVFFAVVGPFTKVLPFSTIAVVGRILSLLLLASGWVQLGCRIGLNSFSVLLSACMYCLIAASGNFSGEWVIGGFESKVPAYGFALLAVAFWMDAFRFQQRRNYIVAGMLSGLSVSLHPVVGLWFCLAMAMSEIVLVRKRRLSPVNASVDSGVYLTLSSFVEHSAAFVLPAILFALPGLIPAVNMVLSSTVDKVSQDTANFIQVFWRLAHHLDPSTFPLYAWYHTAALSLVIVTSLFGLNRAGLRLPESVKSGESTAANSATAGYVAKNPSPCWFLLITLLLAAAVIAGVGIGIGWHSGRAQEITGWQWRASLLRFYPFRVFDALLPITASFLLASVVARVLTSRGQRAAIVAVLIVSVCGVACSKRPDAPSSYNEKIFSEWKTACSWLNENTPVDAMVFGPRESFGLKWYANRAEYICFKDCPQDAAGILEWNSRLWKIFHWSELSFEDGRFDDVDLRTLGRLTNVSYVLTRQLGPFESDPVYQNSVWRIYEIPQ